MSADTKHHAPADRVREGPEPVAGVWTALVVLVVAAVLAPVFAHGCHGGDEDHEPLFTPPARGD